MANTNKKTPSTHSAPVRKRIYKKLTIYQKLQVIDKLEAGMTERDIRELFQLPKTTVNNIKANKAKIKECASCITPQVAERTVRPRNLLLCATETRLNNWIRKQRESGLSISEKQIRQKAQMLFQCVKTERNAEGEFSASHGWFELFKKRYQLREGYFTGKSSCARLREVTKFKEEFRRIIAEEGYSSQQVFNCDEVTLNWRKLPNRTCVARTENCSRYDKENRVALLVGANAAGDVKLKPLLLHRVKSFSVLENIGEYSLPAVYRGDNKSWMNRTIFTEWFNNYFAPFVAKYNAERGLENKALLVMDTSPGRPENLVLDYPHIKVVYFPASITSLLQPMEQGVFSIFKSFYLRQIMTKLVASISTSRRDDMTAYWSQFTLRNAVELIEASWNEVSIETVNSAWKPLWPECVEERLIEFCKTKQHCVEQTLELCTRAGCESITLENIENLLSECDEGFINNETMLSSNNHETVSADVRSKKEDANKQNLFELLHLADKLKQKLCQVEDDEDSRNMFCLVIDALMLSYKNKLQEMSSHFLR